MKKQTPLPEDLSVLARRGELGASERRRLDMLVGASRVERFVHALGQDLDQMPVECDGDQAVLRRVVDQVVTRKITQPDRRGRRVGVALVAAACFVTLGAAALTVPRMLDTAPADQPSECTECPEAEVSEIPAPTPASRARPSTPETDDPRPGTATVERTTPGTPKPEVSGKPRSQSAGVQFANANRLRKAGRTQAAIAAYRRLQREHPTSSEARLSRVVLGRILLQQGAGDAAHRQFVSYVGSDPGGSLTEEALFGQATALRMSGKTAEERRVYQQLIAKFPRSIYADRARERLRGLD